MVEVIEFIFLIIILHIITYGILEICRRNPKNIIILIIGLVLALMLLMNINIMLIILTYIIMLLSAILFIVARTTLGLVLGILIIILLGILLGGLLLYSVESLPRYSYQAGSVPVIPITFY